MIIHVFKNRSTKLFFSLRGKNVGKTYDATFVVKQKQTGVEKNL